MTDREQEIATLTEHLDHWKRLLSEGICGKEYGERTIKSFELAINSLKTDSTIKEAYDKGYKDGQEATAYHIELCKEENPTIPLSVIEDMREEVYQMTLPTTRIARGNTWNDIRYGVNLALKIIDKHISGKEQENV